ncbi:hypothetical protein L7F22_048386 [Adiantum nelumboides]|nr:hypothetical protein [Adiantum nelumboides]
MADNNKENRMSIDDFDFAHEDANDDTSMLVNYLVTWLHQDMGNPALQGEVQQQLHAYGILPPIQQERGPERFQGETSKRGLSMEKGVENPYQQLNQLFEGKPSSKTKGHVQHDRSPSREREESESSDESMEDVAPRRRRAQRYPTSTKRKRSPHSSHRLSVAMLMLLLLLLLPPSCWASSCRCTINSAAQCVVAATSCPTNAPAQCDARCETCSCEASQTKMEPFLHVPATFSLGMQLIISQCLHVKAAGNVVMPLLY